MTEYQGPKVHPLRVKADRKAAQIPHKTVPPRFLDPFINRTELHQRLSSIDDVTWLLIAPPGYGKTAILAQHYSYLSSLSVHTGWLSLSYEDNDPVNLQRNMILAYAPDLLSDPDFSNAKDHISDIWRINGELRSRLNRGVRSHIFLDGIDKITDPICLGLLDMFILGLPENTTLYVAARHTTGLHLHDGRLRGVVKELTLSDLRLSDNEAYEMLGSSWVRADVEVLNSLMHGWPAGLRFMAMDTAAAKRYLDKPGRDVILPTGLADYFESEVCRNVPEETLRDLMEASVINLFSPEILADIPGRQCSWQRISSILRMGLFVRTVEGDPQWMEFHPVFGHYLRRLLYSISPYRLQELERFATEWFQRHGYAIEAMHHVQKLDDDLYAAGIMEKSGTIQIEMQEDQASLATPLLPIELVSKYPVACLNQIYFRLRKGQHGESRLAFEKMRQITNDFTKFEQTVDANLVSGFAYLVQVMINASDDRPITPLELENLENQFSKYIDVDPVLGGGIGTLLALAYISLGRFEEASTICDIGLNKMRNNQAIHVAFFLHCQNGNAAMALGRWKEATLHYEDSYRLTKGRMIHDKYETLIAQVFRAELYYESNDLPKAQELIEAIFEKLPTVNGWLELYATAYGTVTALLGITQGLDAVLPYFSSAESLAKQRNLPRLLQFVRILRLREKTRARQLRKATELFEHPEFQEMLVPADGEDRVWQFRMQTPALLECSRLMIELGRFREASGYLERINKSYLEEADIRLRFTFRMMAMQTAFHLRRYNAAFEHMVEGLELSIEGSLIRRTLNHRTEILEVFDWSIRNGRSVPRRVLTFVNKALREAEEGDTALALRYRSAGRRSGNADGTFVLSPRETEIIALIAEGFATKEIAFRLAISEGTVKTHRKKINEKLGVASRSQAISKAREMLII